MFRLLLVTISFFVCMNAYASSQTEPPKEYQLALGAPTELQTIATTGVLLNSLGYDLYQNGVYPYLPDNVNRYLEPLWSAFWTFNMTMWPHDGGHWARAQQAGGDFIIDEYRFPFPVSRMVELKNASKAQETLTSAGGFEINTLMQWQTRYSYYKNDYAYADSLVHSFIQTLFFPLYSVAIAYADPDDPKTWTDTYGDPTEYTLLVYKHKTGREALDANGKVDTELAGLYREVFWTNLLWTLLDPMFYDSARAFAIDTNKEPRYLRPKWFGTPSYSWQYGTYFNPSPLGYELYLFNYFRIKQELFTTYLRWGRPFKNRGLGLSIPEILQLGKLSADSRLEAWNQDIFGSGISAALELRYKFSRHFHCSLDISWKEKGYIPGRELDQSTRILGKLYFYL